MADDLDLSELERLAAEATAALAAYYADPSIAASSRVSRTKAAASRAAGRALPALLRRIRASERREAEMREALHDANKMLCRAHARIHGLPRTTDTLLAREIENHRAKFKDEYARAALAARKDGGT